MAKTRINNGHRSVLLKFSEKKIREIVDRRHEKKLLKKILSYSNTAIRKKYPEKEMEILRKYDLAQTDKCLTFQFPSGRVDGFSFGNEYDEETDKWIEPDVADIPYSRGCRTKEVYLGSKELEDTIAEYHKVNKENIEIIRQKQKDCRSLIEFAKYIEDVLEVIKVPKELEEQLLAKSTALVALSPEVIERIQKDFLS